MGDWNRVFFPEACLWGGTLCGHTLSETSAEPFCGLLCAYLSPADCAFLHHQHAELSGHSPTSHLLGQSQNGLQDSKSIRLFLLFFSALSSLFCISTVSLTFFSSLHLDSVARILGSQELAQYTRILPLSSHFFITVSQFCIRKKKPMCQVSENRSLTAEGEKERH